ncbi:MAG: hypothetical protein HYR76_08250 [Ignavibacteria bacterium]|nr:hypothetical protein [Ignavibacteria bacterium]
MKKEVETIINNQTEFLKYLKSKFTLIHMSNFFFRDFHYGVMSYLQDHGTKMKYHDAEHVAREVGAVLEEKGIFKKIDHQSWLLNYPEFALPRVEKIEKKAS